MFCPFTATSCYAEKSLTRNLFFFFWVRGRLIGIHDFFYGDYLVLLFQPQPKLQGILLFHPKMITFISANSALMAQRVTFELLITGTSMT